MNNTKDIRQSQGLLRATSREILAPDRVQLEYRCWVRGRYSC